MKITTIDILFELRHLKQISEFTEALFPTYLQTGFSINCVPNGNWVHCGEVLKATWLGELSDKCAAVIYVYPSILSITILE